MRVIRRVVVALASFVILPATVYALVVACGLRQGLVGWRAARRERGSIQSGPDREGANRHQRSQPGSTEFLTCLPGSTN